jgi:hypothetical protein
MPFDYNLLSVMKLGLARLLIPSLLCGLAIAIINGLAVKAADSIVTTTTHASETLPPHEVSETARNVPHTECVTGALRGELHLQPTQELDALLAGTEASWRVFHAGNPTLYRGFSQKGVDSKSMVEFLRGDRRYEPRSWNFSNHLARETENGHPFEEALNIAEQRAAQDIIERIRRDGVAGFVGKDMRNAAVDRSAEQKKDVNMIFFGPESWKPGSIFYAEDGAEQRIEKGEPPEGVRAVFMEMRESKPRGLETSGEYGVLSRVRPQDISGVYLGAKVTSWDEHRRPNSHFAWHYISTSRHEDGSVSKFTIYGAEKFERMYPSGRANRDLRPTGKILELTPGQGVTQEVRNAFDDLPEELWDVVFAIVN